ncbi:MAG: hypothetical protein R2854_10420 [Caldilineaceae bacterium]
MDWSSWTYQQLTRKALGLALIAGPAFFVLAAIVKLNVGMDRAKFCGRHPDRLRVHPFCRRLLGTGPALGQEMPFFDCSARCSGSPG